LKSRELLREWGGADQAATVLCCMASSGKFEGDCGTVLFFVEKKQSPLLHCVCGEAQVLQKEAVW
jgi:hypothetical protein